MHILFRLAIENIKLIHEDCTEHLHIRTATMKLDNKAEQEGKIKNKIYKKVH